MVISLDGTCKKCGADIHLTFDADESSTREISLFAHCSICGNRGEYGDTERIYQIIDTLDTTSKRIAFANINNITLHNYDLN